MTEQGFYFFVVIFMVGGAGLAAGLYGLWLKKHGH